MKTHFSPPPPRKLLSWVSFLLVGFFAFVMLIPGCEQAAKLNPPEPPPDQGIASASLRLTDEVNEVRQAFARTLSLAVNGSADLRSFLHAQIQANDTSNQELLYIAAKDRVIVGPTTFEDLLTAYIDSTTLARFGRKFFQMVPELSPLLAINMPDLEEVNPFTWNVSHVPFVAAVYDYEEGNPDYELFFKGLLNTDFEPGEIPNPTLSVWDAEITHLVRAGGFLHDGNHIRDLLPTSLTSDCEAFLEDAISVYESYDLTGQEFYLVIYDDLMDMYEECMNPSSVGEPDPCYEPCERDCETNTEHLVRFKINGWSTFAMIRNQHFERWYKFHVKFVHQYRNSLGTVVEDDPVFTSPKSYRKSELLDCSGSGPCSGKWITLNHELWDKDWDISELASPYSLAFAEVDNVTGSVSFGLDFAVKWIIDGLFELTGGINSTFSFKGAETVILGQDNVFYCSPIMETNSTGDVHFKCN